MKRYHEYTNQELLELTEADITVLLSYELLQAGIPLKMQEPPSAKPPTGTPSIYLYEVRMDYAKAVRKDVADKIMEFVSQFPACDVKYSGNYSSPKYAVPTNEPGFVSTRIDLYTQEEAEALNKAQQEFHDKYGDIKEQHEAYKKWQGQVDDCEREIILAIQAAQVARSNGLYYSSAFDDYINLANGDEHIAKAFFIKAYGESIYNSYIAV